MTTSPQPTSGDRLDRQFAEALAQRDYPAAVSALTAIHNAGDHTQAARLLQVALEMTAVAGQQLGAQAVTVTQTAHTVEPGATMIGFQADRL